MPDLFVSLDQTQIPGEQFAPEVRAEIAVVAPSVVDDGDITTGKLADDAVTSEKLHDDAVHPEHIADNAVESAAIDDDAVQTAHIADDAVTRAKAGVGVMTATDKTGTARTLETSGPYTLAEFGGIASPDPNTIYVII